MIAKDAQTEVPRCRQVPVDGASLFVREIGSGRTIVILHGGPDFDHRYLLPELDLLAGGYRLVYYDQRGRGRSATGVTPEDVNLISEIADFDRLREALGLSQMALLGHSWGALLALEYAAHHPARVSHLILMNPAPASRQDLLVLRRHMESIPGYAAEREQITRGLEFQQGDPAAVARYYRMHFSPTIKSPEQLENIVARVSSEYAAGDILRARAIEKRLYQDTWLVDGYDVLTRLDAVHAPALVIHGTDDFIPEVCSRHIVGALRTATFAMLADCGHFSYLDCPDQVRRQIDEFFRNSNPLPD